MNNLIVLFSLVTTLNLHAQSRFEKLWTQVEIFEQEGKTKSADELVQSIYKKAQKKQNSNQIIKALLYQSKYALELKENAELTIVQNLEKEIASATFPTNAILQSILADFKWQYFNQHRWQIYNRTQTSEIINDDFRTWDLNRMFTSIHENFKQSISKTEQLQNIDINQYQYIIVSGEDNSKILRPTLYDLLAHKALTFFNTSESRITKPKERFYIDKKDYFLPSSVFTKLKLKANDSILSQLEVLKTYQKLEAFHLKNKNNKALIDVYLARLQFVNNNATKSNKQETYINSLKNSYESLHKGNAYATVKATYAVAISSIATKDKNPENRKKALDICNEIITDYPKGEGTILAQNLKNNILKETLQIQNESQIPTVTSKVLVKYNNIEKLYFRIYPVAYLQNFDHYNYNERNQKIKAFLNTEKFTNAFEVPLPQKNDYFQHSTEVVIPKLNIGKHIILASTDANFNTEKTFTWNYQTVSNLTAIESTYKGDKIFQVLHRTTGEPIQNAKVSFGISNRKTNDIGEVAFNSRKRNAAVIITTENDTLYLGKHYHNNYYGNNEKDQNKINSAKAFLFMDRSIYRPGQKIYFKGIVISRQNYKSKVVSDKNYLIEIRDANNQELKTFDLTTNAFGSFSESFMLPTNILTGNFSIRVKSKKNDFKSFRDAYTHFSVEEYKRPKFEVTFKPITETILVDQEVCVKGNANALLGTAISDAKVSYRIVRKTQYNHWKYWRGYHTPETQEIKIGEVLTDDKGGFEIDFIALPDPTSNKEDLPVFNYEIIADVTDINGETRSATTNVKVGYHSMNITLETDGDFTYNTTETIRVNTQNLNGEFAPASINLKVYKLEAPNRVLRKRKLSAPDMPLLTKSDFVALFPHEAYADENDSKNWKKGDLIFEKTIDTKTQREIDLDIKNQKWKSGIYVITAKGKDKFDNTIEQEKQVTVNNPNDTVLADNQLFDFDILNEDALQKDGFITLKLATATTNLNVLVESYYKSEHFYKKNIVVNGSKTIHIPFSQLKVAPDTKIQLSFSFVKNEEHHTDYETIYLPSKKEFLTIETATFRDKIQPGAKEKWSFTIKNEDKKGTASEVLASMYDASLDQFKPHNWNKNLALPSYYYNNISPKNCRSFSTNSFKSLNHKYIKHLYFTKTFSKLNHFGFGLNYNVQYEYLQYLSSKIILKDGEGMISGSIIDDENMPLPGATVLIKGTTIGTSTDFDGKFNLKIKKGDVLVVSFVGYITQFITVKSIKDTYIKMVNDPNIDQVVITAMGIKRKTDEITSSNQIVRTEKLSQSVNSDVISGLAGKVSGLQINRLNNGVNSDTKIALRGNRSITGTEDALIIIDGEIATKEQLQQLNKNEIASVNIIKGAKGAALYGSKGANGVIVITSKGSNWKPTTDMSKLFEAEEINFSNAKIRKNLNETAFFYPHLKTDAKGNLTFEFETPEALTRWKVQLLGHTKTGVSGKFTQNVVTQKELMVIPNPPRFLRENDTLVFQTKIASLSDETLNGQAKLELYDAISGKEISTQLISVLSQSKTNQVQDFKLTSKGNTSISWKLVIPEGVQAIEYKVLAKAGNFTDGESSILPVLTNRMLVTESIPLTVRANSSKNYSFNKLKNNNSTTLKNQQLTLEYTTNPAWYAIQSLPYVMEFPHECAEQTFARYYANTLGSFIMNSNPKIKTVFESWKANGKLTSKLEQNEELKQILISETPWLRDAQNETERKKRLGLLFDLEKLASQEKSMLKKLNQLQMSSGGFPWFKGGYENENITRHIVAGFGHLQKLGITNAIDEKMIEKATQYLDVKFVQNHNKKLKYTTEEKIGFGYYELYYLYTRSFFKNQFKFSTEARRITNLYLNKAKKGWLNQSVSEKAMLSLVLHRFNEKTLTKQILTHLEETAITNENKGMYWKSNTSGWYWHEAPIETQALVIEAFQEITNGKKIIEELQIWLLNNKRKNNWETTKATTEAVYALLLQGNDWLSTEGTATIKIGDEKIKTSKLDETKLEAGTGYFKLNWNANEITPKMADISIKNTSNATQFGGYYWQYFEQLDKITNEEHKNDIQLHKELFLKKNTDNGPTLTKIKNTDVKVGDMVTVRIELQVNDTFEYVHLKDMRASAFEPVDVISKYKWQDGLGYYKSTKDVATHFFFDRLPKGTYVLEYDVRVNNSGSFSNGISSIQSMYTPEFTSHSKGLNVKVND